MKLPFKFYRLPVRFDVARLQMEVNALGVDAWQKHMTGFAGNSAVRLVSALGQENDDFIGPMGATAHFLKSPYMRQILAGFKVAWSRSRLMRLAPGAEVPEHSDVNYHWFSRVRLHIPIQTDGKVSFTCDGETVHMAEGEAWIFDNTRPHSVVNGGERERIHLVADTSGSAAFWQLVGASRVTDFAQPLPPDAAFWPYRDGDDVLPMFERFNAMNVMHPAEVEIMCGELLAGLRGAETDAERTSTDQFVGLVLAFCREWRMLWSLFGPTQDGWQHFGRLRDWASAENNRQASSVYCQFMNRPAKEVFHARVLLYALVLPDKKPIVDVDRTEIRLDAAASEAVSVTSSRRKLMLDDRFVKPVFIASTPRSGSSALFETLMQAKDLWTVGGESHWLVERLPQLQPWASGVGSNRLTADHVDSEVRKFVLENLSAELRDRDGMRYDGNNVVRVLEKTPKHSLRIPFFSEIFPDARYVFLWRDPYENIASIIEAWHSGGWVTYPNLPGWGGPWSLLLPPGWESLRGASMEDIAVFQWLRTNEVIINDLERLPSDRWMMANYADFVSNPAEVISEICAFAGVEADERLTQYVSRPLPLSAHTLTPPREGKWRAHESGLGKFSAQLEEMRRRLLDMQGSKRAY